MQQAWTKFFKERNFVNFLHKGGIAFSLSFSPAGKRPVAKLLNSTIRVDKYLVLVIFGLAPSTDSVQNWKFQKLNKALLSSIFQLQQKYGGLVCTFAPSHI